MPISSTSFPDLSWLLIWMIESAGMEQLASWACLTASDRALKNGGASHFGIGAEINSGLSKIGFDFPGRKLSRFLAACLLAVWIQTGLTFDMMSGVIGSVILAGL